jgi:branched-chain amino acid aminotransferase
MNEVCLNGKMISGDEPILNAANRGFRYGDALFETMKLKDGKIQLVSHHFERLFAGLSLLKMDIPKFFTQEKLLEGIIQLCKRNKCEELARIRLTVFRSEGELFSPNNSLQYLIECWPLNEENNKLNENGFVIDIFPDARKACDKFSNLKSANYLPNIMAALYAKENKLNDCLLLNAQGHICEAVIANIFWIKNEIIYTPPLSEGCVAGVMRRYLIEQLKAVKEKPCDIKDLGEANEIFLTNAIKGIRWVKQFKNKIYKKIGTQEIYTNYLIPMFK